MSYIKMAVVIKVSDSSITTERYHQIDRDLKQHIGDVCERAFINTAEIVSISIDSNCKANPAVEIK